ncbi:MAG: glycosyltransferase family 1 protein [Rhodocyclaceae bacterium]|nr:glycosyltransferase family 1 protein [Rhodocyclaceae bacterium]
MATTNARRLSVALVTETYLPEVNGVAMTLGRLTEGLAARGHRVRIVRPRQKHEATGRLPDGQLLTPGLPIPRYPDLRFGLPAGDRLHSAWLERMPDIVHIATEGPLGYSALMAARRLGIPVLSTFHTNFHSYSRHYGIGWLRRGIEGYLRWFHNRTAATLVPTAALARQLGEKGFRDVRVLSRGVDSNQFNPARRLSLLRLQWGARADDLVCIVVGRLAPEKNLALAFAAFEAIRTERPNARMVCVGDGPLARTLARRHPEVHFCGARHGAELAAHYASADLFLFPSLTETFGNVVTEALASGLPVVAFDHAAAGELIDNGHNGLLATPGNAGAFIAASRKLARAVAGQTAQRDACADSVRHLSWERIHDSYAEMLVEIVARRPAVLPIGTEIHFAPD